MRNYFINLHLGLSPYYRGSSCNFWALYDQNPAYVGATIHLLSKGLDSGDMLFHCLPRLAKGDTAFDFTMRSVFVAQQGLVEMVKQIKLYNSFNIKAHHKNSIILISLFLTFWAEKC